MKQNEKRKIIEKINEFVPSGTNFKLNLTGDQFVWTPGGPPAGQIKNETVFRLFRFLKKAGVKLEEIPICWEYFLNSPAEAGEIIFKIYPKFCESVDYARLTNNWDNVSQDKIFKADVLRAVGGSNYGWEWDTKTWKFETGARHLGFHYSGFWNPKTRKVSFSDELDCPRGIT